MTRKASMSTKFLSPTERLALQTGSVMQVYISKLDGANPDTSLQVTLKPLDGSSGKPSISVQQSYSNAHAARVALEGGSAQRVSSPSIGSVNKLSVQQPWDTSASKRPNARTNTKGTPSRGNTPKLPEGAIFLNTLKTGMELQGIVQSNTNYAAFVSANVYRAATGGRACEINGLLHKVDIVDGSNLILNPNTGKGTKLKVYVKEVFKQSGRFSLTTGMYALISCLF